MIVCGGRHYHNREFVFKILGILHARWPIHCVVYGGAKGADLLGKEWADSVGVTAECYPADWDTHGNSAGPIRNRQMAETGPDLVVAFPGTNGTASMVGIARELLIPVVQPKED